MSTGLLPQRVLTVALAIALLVMVTAVSLALRQPSLGVDLMPGEHGLVVMQPRSEAAIAVLKPGDRIVALLGSEGTEQRLGADDLTPEPDMRYTRYWEMDAFFARQSTLHALLLSQGEHATLRMSDGRVLQLPLSPSRPLSSLPPVFWFQLFCAVAGLLAGASVWAFRWRDAATFYYALTGVGMLLFASSAAIYSTRELALNGRLFMALSSLNEFGALLFCGGLIAVLWYYPTRLSRFGAGPLLIAAYVGAGIAIPLRLHDSVETVAHLPITLGYFSTYLLAAVQWWKTRGDAFQRAALRVFLLAWLFGSGAFVAFMYLPAMAGIDNGAMQGYAFGFFLLIYAGVAAGVLRYRLFQLDRWWFAAWRLSFGGVVVIVLDLFLIDQLRIDARTSLLVSLALAGWLYFPLRQWLWQRLTRQHRDDRIALIPRVTEVLSRQDRSEAESWKSLLQEIYAPLVIEPAEHAVRDAIADSGLSLDVAAGEGSAAMRLRYAKAGARLFVSEDLATLYDLRRLFGEVLRYRNMLEEGVVRERRRVARDLHDDVGARLLTMSHRLPPEHADQARQALSELRAVVHSMQAPPISVGALFAQWHDEAIERCEAAGVQLHWSLENSGVEHELGGGEALSLSRVLREALSNALRHASPDALWLHFKLDDTTLTAQLRHPHDGVAPEHWVASLGLQNLRNRLERFGGGITWTKTEGDLLTEWNADLRQRL